MNNLVTAQFNLSDNSREISYLYFVLGENKYAVKINQVMEIIKLPKLDYPQRLSSNIVGIIDYNNFNINIVDIRFYLNLKVTPYNTSTHVLIVKTEENIMGIIIDKPEDIFVPDTTYSGNISAENGIIEKIYKKDDDFISIININSLENMIKTHQEQNNIDILSLFPKDEKSQEILEKRRKFLELKNNSDITKNIFSQNKYIVFSINKNLYCIDLDYSKEFVKDVPITPIPCDLNYIEGIISLRGDFITIVNLSEFINEEMQVNNEKNNIIVINFADYKVGIAVDEIHKIEDITPENILPQKDEKSDFIIGETIINDNIISIIDIKNILADERFFIEQD